MEWKEKKYRYLQESIPLFPLNYYIVLQIDGITDKQYTFPQLLRVCKNAASGLVRLGVKKHDVIAIFSQNSPEYAVIFLAASAAGATLTTINSTYTVCEFWIRDKSNFDLGAAC